MHREIPCLPPWATPASHITTKLSKPRDWHWDNQSDLFKFHWLYVCLFVCVCVCVRVYIYSWITWATWNAFPQQSRCSMVLSLASPLYSQTPPSLLLTLTATNLYSWLGDYVTQGCQINRILQYAFFGGWLFRSASPLRSTLGFACVGGSPLPCWLLHCGVDAAPVGHTTSLSEGHLSSFQAWAMTSKAAVNFCVQILLWM